MSPRGWALFVSQSVHSEVAPRLILSVGRGLLGRTHAFWSFWEDLRDARARTWLMGFNAERVGIYMTAADDLMSRGC